MSMFLTLSEVSVSDINDDDNGGNSSKSNSVNSLQSTGISASSQVINWPSLSNKEECNQWKSTL